MSTDKNRRSVRKKTAAFWRREDERGMLPGEVHQTMSDRWNRFRLDPIAYLDARYGIEYMEPQAHWVNGCPMGNGDLGVLAYGPPEATLFSIGKTDLWDYTPFGKPSYPKGHLADLRNVLARGDVEAFERLKAELVRRPSRQTTAKPGGMLRLELYPCAVVSRFRQRLSFANAETVQTWTPSGDRPHARRGFEGHGTTVTLTSFVHAARNVFAVQVKPDPGMPWHGDVRLSLWREDDPNMEKPVAHIRGNRFWICQDLPGGEHFVLMATTDTRGFKFVELNGHVSAAGKPFNPVLNLYCTLVTSRDSDNPLKQAHRNLDEALKAGFDALRETHRQWWHGFWRRGYVATPWKTVERAWYQALYQQASICRPGRLSPGLQGNWIKENYPAWNADFHNNINIQIVYWGQYTANRLELGEPFYRLFWEALPQAKRAAAGYFQMRGARFPISMGRDGIETAGPLLLSTWIGAGGWLAEHFWWHYRFSGDCEFLARYAYPLLKECALFYEDYLQEDPEGNLYVFPTVQMEINIGRIDGAGRNSSWDLPVVIRTFQMVLEAAAALDVDAADRERWQDVLSRLPSVPANEEGVWMEFDDKGGLWHQWDWARFMAIFPMELVAADAGPDALRRQAQATIEEYYRFRKNPDAVGGFSGAIQATALLRMGHVERGLRMAEFVCKSLSPSGFVTGHGAHYLQVDTPPGLTVFLNEMLLQSFDSSAGSTSSPQAGSGQGGVLRVFPAVPPGPEPIRFHSLRAQGGFLVSAERRNNLTQYVIVQSLCGNRLRMHNPFVGEPDLGVQVKVYELHAATRFDRVEDQGAMAPYLDHIYLPGQTIEFPTRKGQVYVISKEIPWISNIPIVDDARGVS
ncbi:MAG: glycoside hydrolase N-terminal domain-containing protein [Verrucomicrobia bacterium]|nr:glycoside hydrolase N-terminal domain-containing protein [Verrucomicrobiota bacterium]